MKEQLLKREVQASRMFLRFVPFCCNVCKRIGKETNISLYGIKTCDHLFMCTRCEAAFYCSREHQKEDFPYHRVVCKCLEQLRLKSDLADSTDRETFDEAVTVLTEKLGRQLNSEEIQTLLWRPSCFKCKTTKGVKSCKKCLLTCFCDVHAKEYITEHLQYPENCLNNLMVVLCEQVLRDCGWPPTYVPPPFKDYVRLPANFEDFFLRCGEMAAAVPVQLLQMNTLSVPCTIVYFLQHVLYAPHRLRRRHLPKDEKEEKKEEKKKEDEKKTVKEEEEKEMSVFSVGDEAALAGLQRLELHIVGADSKDLFSMTKYEVIHHLLPALRELVIVFVGPDVEGPSFTPQLCESCRGGGKQTIFSYSKLTYDEYMAAETKTEKGKEFRKPDLCVCFNSDLSFYKKKDKNNTWVKTIEEIKKRKIVSLFTSYNECDWTADMKFLKESEADVFHADVNPFRGGQPLRDYFDGGFFYENQFLIGFH